MNKGIVFDIQRFAVHDGPGIRTLVFLKGCPLACAWCENPESQSPEPQLLFYPDRCIGCGSCVAECPHGALTIAEGATRYEREKCMHCLSCTRVCPSRALQRCGERKTVGEVLNIVRKDRIFYAQSGGGMTLSGGEPLLQAGFAIDLLEACKEDDIDTALETCGQWQWPAFERLLPFLDLVLFDIKHMGSREHEHGTGVRNERILENLERLCERNVPLIARLPIVAGYNDGEENAAATAERLRGKKNVRAVHLLPYHDLGAYKYRLLGRTYASERMRRPDDESLRRLQAVYERADLKVKIEG